MKRGILAFTLLATAVVTASPEPPRPLAIEPFRQAVAGITVTSRSFGPNQAIPSRFADYGEKISPELSWTGVPSSAKSLVVLAEDPDAKEPTPFVHWVLYNLPTSFSTLPESVPGTPRLPEFGGALQGRSSRGTTGYFGPRPPKGEPEHHYHFEVVALDTMLSLDPGATPTKLLAALNGHVVGTGELIGLYRAP